MCCMMEKLIIDFVIFLFLVAGLITFIKDAIIAVKNYSLKKQNSEYYAQNGIYSYDGDTGNYYNIGNYDSSVNCDIGGGDCGTGN